MGAMLHRDAAGRSALARRPTAAQAPIERPGKWRPGVTGSGSVGRSRFAREAALRPLGRRGEGWIGIQMLLEVGCLAVAVLTGPAVTGPPRAVAAIVGIGLLVVGVVLFAWGAAHLGHSFSVWVSPRPDGELVTSGPYQYARHPVCTAQVLLCAGWSLAAASVAGLVLVPVVAWYLDRYKLAREEVMLSARYPGYAAYVASVPHRMLPRPPRMEPVSRGSGT